jgi:hypothetical protein
VTVVPRRAIAFTLVALGVAVACSPNDIVVGSNLGGGGTGGASSTGDCPGDLGLPAAPALTNLVASVVGGDVTLSFDPRDDALDYRVYVLPNKGDVSGDTNANATYRCAGDYEIPPVSNEDAPIMPPGAGLHTRINSQVMGYPRTTSDAQLGYVMTTPGPGLVPVYALGDPGKDADNDCYFQRYPESRVKRYTASAAERASLVAQRWRDDGVAFYAPADGTAGTAVVYRQDPLYMAPSAELTARMAMGPPPAPAFSVYTSPGPGSAPLMRVFYDAICGRSHDELVAGMARFNKAYEQGTQPFGELHYSGIAGPTTLVVEALDRLCPFQGIVSPMARPPSVMVNVAYPAFMTPDQVRAVSPTGEVYVNGQGPPATPHAVARSCLQVSPSPLPALDWSYDGQPETYTSPVQTTFQTWTFESPTFDFDLDFVATDEWAVGSLFGELWLTWGENGGLTSGRVLVTPKAKPTLGASDYVHATMEVDMFVTDRRYPQLVVADQGSPPSSFIVQARGGATTPADLNAELCDALAWDPGAQCPAWDLHLIGGATPFLAPHFEFNGRMGTDRTIRVEAYVSTSRVYVLLDGAPYGCGDIPAGQLLAGPATVSFADVLFVSMQDFIVPWYPFHSAKMQTFTTRHFSNLGFASHVAAPAWDETLLPCVPATALH